MKTKPNFFLLLLFVVLGAAPSLLALPMDPIRGDGDESNNAPAGADLRAGAHAHADAREAGAGAGDASQTARGSTVAVSEETSATDDGANQPGVGATEVVGAIAQPIAGVAVPATLTLENFRTALEEHPDAERVIINEEAGVLSLQFLSEQTSNQRPEAIRGHNMDVIEALRAALVAEHPDVNVEDCFTAVNQFSSLTSYPSLSAVQLRTLFERIDAAVAEATFDANEEVTPVGDDKSIKAQSKKKRKPQSKAKSKQGSDRGYSTSAITSASKSKPVMGDEDNDLKINKFPAALKQGPYSIQSKAAHEKLRVSTSNSRVAKCYVEAMELYRLADEAVKRKAVYEVKCLEVAAEHAKSSAISLLEESIARHDTALATYKESITNFKKLDEDITTLQTRPWQKAKTIGSRVEVKQVYASKEAAHEEFNEVIKCIESGAEAKLKSLAAFVSSKQELSEHYDQVKEFYLKAAECYKAAIDNRFSDIDDWCYGERRKVIETKIKEAELKKAIADILLKASEAKSKAIDAELEEKVDVKDNYNNAMEQYYNLAKLVENIGVNKFSLDGHQQKESIIQSAEMYLKAAENSQKGTESSRKYLEIARRYEEAAEIYKQAADFHCQYNQADKIRVLEDAVASLKSSIENESKSIGCQLSANSLDGKRYSKIADLHKKAADAYRLQVEFLIEKKDQKTVWNINQAARHYSEAARWLEQRDSTRSGELEQEAERLSNEATSEEWQVDLK